MIGVFDSGIGGFSVVRQLFEQLPEYEVIYFGDVARFPYGNHTQDKIVDYSGQLYDFLRTEGAQAMAIACHTASAAASTILRDKADMPVFDVVSAGSKVAVEKSINKKIGVMATKGTVKSGKYVEVLKSFGEVAVFQYACPSLATLIEDAEIDDHLLISFNDPESQNIISKAQIHRINITPDSHFIKQEDISLKGEHNLLNARMAATIASLTGMNDATIKAQLATFPGCNGRQEVIIQKDGVTFVDDTSSTSDISTIVALKAFPNSIFIMGGKPHGGCNMEKVAKNLNTKYLVLIKSPLSQLLTPYIDKYYPNGSYEIVENLTEAIAAARKHATDGDYVVISPCAAYYIYFRGKIDDCDKLKTMI